MGIRHPNDRNRVMKHAALVCERPELRWRAMRRSLQSRLSAPRQFQSKCEGVSSNNLVRGKTRGLYRAGEVQGAEYPGSLARSRRSAFTRSSCNETCSHRAWRTTASWNAHYYCQSHAESESDAGRLCGLNAHAHPDFLDRLLLGEKGSGTPGVRFSIKKQPKRLF